MVVDYAYHYPGFAGDVVVVSSLVMAIGFGMLVASLWILRAPGGGHLRSRGFAVRQLLQPLLLVAAVLCLGLTGPAEATLVILDPTSDADDQPLTSDLQLAGRGRGVAVVAAALALTGLGSVLGAPEAASYLRRLVQVASMGVSGLMLLAPPVATTPLLVGQDATAFYFRGGTSIDVSFFGGALLIIILLLGGLMSKATGPAHTKT